MTAGAKAWVIMPYGNVLITVIISSSPCFGLVTGSLRVVNAVKALERLPRAYYDFIDVFSEEQTDALPSNSQYDYAININNKQPPHKPIYNLS